MKYIYFYIDKHDDYAIKTYESEVSSPALVAEKLGVDEVYPTEQWAASIKEKKYGQPHWVVSGFCEPMQRAEFDPGAEYYKAIGNWFDDKDIADIVAEEIKEIFRKYNPNKPYEQ